MLMLCPLNKKTYALVFPWMWHVRKVQCLLIKSSLLCFIESQNVPFSAKLTVDGRKMAHPQWGAPISQTCICLVIKLYAVSTITRHLLSVSQV